jgi:hypothetical protein
MNSKEFVIWLKGFTEGVHEFNITPKQWDLLKEKLTEVNDYPYSTSVGIGGFGTTGTSTTFSSGSGAWSYTTSNDKTLLND